MKLDVGTLLRWFLVNSTQQKPLISASAFNWRFNHLKALLIHCQLRQNHLNFQEFYSLVFWKYNSLLKLYLYGICIFIYLHILIYIDMHTYICLYIFRLLRFFKLLCHTWVSGNVYFWFLKFIHSFTYCSEPNLNRIFVPGLIRLVDFIYRYERYSFSYLISSLKISFRWVVLTFTLLNIVLI